MTSGTYQHRLPRFERADLAAQRRIRCIIWHPFCLAKSNQGTCGSARGILPSALPRLSGPADPADLFLPISTTRNRLVTKTTFSSIPNRMIFRRVCRLLDRGLATGVLPVNKVDHNVRGIDVAGRAMIRFRAGC